MSTVHHDPVALVIERLTAGGFGPRSTADDQWSSRCPAHGGSKHNLCISRGESGKVLMYCQHAPGCSTASIVDALGLQWSDLFTDSPAPRSTTSPARTQPATKKAAMQKPVKPDTVYATLDAAIFATQRFIEKDGECRRAGSWMYYNADGSDFACVVRFDQAEEKTYRQHTKVDGGWIRKGPKTKWPLFNLGCVADARIVFMAEGEKSAQKVAGIGLACVTTAKGAKSPDKTDLAPLAGKDVVILPDNDSEGESYARKLVDLLHEVGAASVKIVRIPGLEPKGDAYDWAVARKAAGWTKEQCRDELARLADQAEPEPSASAANSRAAEPEWIVGDKGAWSPCTSNVVRWLEWKGLDKDYVFDEFLGTLTVRGQEIKDVSPTQLAIAVEEDRRVPVSTGKVKEAIDVVAARNAVDSLKDYFRSLRWDGTPRVDGYFDRVYNAVSMSLGVPQEEFDAVDADEMDKAKRYCEFVSRSFLIGLAARALDPGCQVDTMPVLIGDQGLNKSASFRELCPRPEWFTDDIGDIHTKDACASLNGILIVEFAEFNRLMRASAAAAKSFLTKRDDRYREAYGRYTVRHLRRCVFVGTTNEEMPLIDTENRRFYPLQAGQADLDYIRKNRDQILAEAAHRFQAGEQWWTRDEETLGVVRTRQDMAQKPDQWAEVLAEKLVTLGATFTQAEAFNALDIPVERRTSKAVSDMGNALKKAGCKSLPRKQIPGVGRVTMYSNPFGADVVPY